ncbi:MAG: fibronectin type III domain-containing protein [Eubacterium sp.]|nr:fibronectin type III domain-containing protein [Eubacterium sp.]
MKKTLLKMLCIVMASLTVASSATPVFAASNTPKKMAVSVVKVEYFTGLRVKWKKQKKVTGYQIAYTNTVTNKTKKVKVKGAKKTNTLIKNLAENTKYSIKIRAYKTVTKKVKKKKTTKTYYGKWSKVKKIKTQSKPVPQITYYWQELVPDKLRVDTVNNLTEVKNSATNQWERRNGDFNSWKYNTYTGTLYGYGLKKIYDYIESHHPVNKYAVMLYAAYYINLNFSYATDLKGGGWRNNVTTEDAVYHKCTEGAAMIEDSSGVCMNYSALGRDIAYLYGYQVKIVNNDSHTWNQIQNAKGEWIDWDFCVLSFGSYVANPVLRTLDYQFIREKAKELNVEEDALFDAINQINEDININDCTDQSIFNENFINDVPVIKDVSCVQKYGETSLYVTCTTKCKERGLKSWMIEGDIDGVCETQHVANELVHRFGTETTWWKSEGTGIQYKIIDAKTNKAVESATDIDVNGTYIVYARRYEAWKRNYAKLGVKKQYINICTAWSEPYTVHVPDLFEQPEDPESIPENPEDSENPDNSNLE